MVAAVAAIVAGGCAPTGAESAGGPGTVAAAAPDDVGRADEDGPAAARGRAGAVATESPSVASGAASPGENVRSYRAPRRTPRHPPPTHVAIPALGVASDLQVLGANEDGTVEVPDRWEQAGWYGDGTAPGAPGSAVILGHVDSRAGPAVFARLHELTPGDEILVTTADGPVRTFVVERLEQHAKVRFPTAEVYYPTLRPLLRLVTCGGAFDPGDGHYRDNVIVFARLAA